MEQQTEVQPFASDSPVKKSHAIYKLGWSLFSFYYQCKGDEEENLHKRVKRKMDEGIQRRARERNEWNGDRHQSRPVPNLLKPRS